jgi:hypothetical protein
VLTFCPPFATTVWMRSRVHSDTAHMWSTPHMATSTSLAQLYILVVSIANFTN